MPRASQADKCMSANTYLDIRDGLLQIGQES